MRSIEDKLIKYALPYEIIGGSRFFERKEVNDIGDINALFQFYIDIGDPMSVPDFNKLLMGYFSNSVYDLLSI